jgi:hypothetical protein
MNNNKYKKKMPIKRLKSELKILDTFISNYFACYNNLITYKKPVNNIIASINIFLIMNNDKIINILFKFKENYPFTSPILEINNNNYFNLLETDSKQLKKINYPDKCICCTSILCNWSITYNLTDIIKEIKNNYEIKIKIVNFIFSNKVVDKFLFGIDDLKIYINKYF